MAKKLDKLRLQKTELEKQIKDLEKKEKGEKRRLDTRRKVLIGAAILAKVKTGAIREEDFLSMMNGFLKRDYERALFDLPPLSEMAASSQTQKGGSNNASIAPMTAKVRLVQNDLDQPSPGRSGMVNSSEEELDSDIDRQTDKQSSDSNTLHRAEDKKSPSRKAQTTTHRSETTKPPTTKHRLPEVDHQDELLKEFNM